MENKLTPMKDNSRDDKKGSRILRSQALSSGILRKKAIGEFYRILINPLVVYAKQLLITFEKLLNLDPGGMVTYIFLLKSLRNFLSGT